MVMFLNKHKVGVFLALLWAALFALCLQFPYTGDDWAWGSSIGLERLSNFFANYNGRYLGNLLVLVLARNVVLRSVVVAGVLVAIVYELYAIAGKRHFSTLVVGAVLLMLVYYTVGAQAIVWVSGFTNYAVPALLVLMYVNASKSLLFAPGAREAASLQGKVSAAGHVGGKHAGRLPGKISATPLQCAGMFALAVANGLFMENITLFNVAIGFIMVVYCRVAHGYWSKAQIAFFAGAVVGAAIMFSNGAYWMIAAGNDDYRNVSGEGSQSIMSRLLHTMTYYLVEYNWAVLACLLLTVVFRIIDQKGTPPSCALGEAGIDANVSCEDSPARKVAPANSSAFKANQADSPARVAKPADSAAREASHRIKAADVVFTVVLFGACALSVYCVFLVKDQAGALRTALVALACLAFLAALVWYLIAHRGKCYARICLLLVVCVAIIVAPLLVVNPIGPRNFFPPYVLECAIACCMWDALVKDASRMLVLVLAALLIAVFVRWFAVYVPVHKADVKRNDAVAAAVARGDESLKISKLPAAGYVHCPDPTEGVWETRYKLFYGVPENFDIMM